MKKINSLILTITMLVTLLAGSACFAEEVKEPNEHYAQNENCSEKFKSFKFSKGKKIIAGVTAGTVALTSAMVVIWKLLGKKLPENLKSKLSFLFAKKTQDDDANFEIETTNDEITEPLITDSINSAIVNINSNNADDKNNMSWIRYVKNITVNLGLPFVSVILIAKLYKEKVFLVVTYLLIRNGTLKLGKDCSNMIYSKFSCTDRK